MKNIPDRIYLQVGDTAPSDCDFNELSQEAVTWCRDRIWRNDIEYIKRSKFGLSTELARKEEREKAVAALRQVIAWCGECENKCYTSCGDECLIDKFNELLKGE